MINFFQAFLVLAASAYLSFGATTKTVPAGKEFELLLFVSSAGQETIGTDVVLNFDPKFFSATKIVRGEAYPSYPPNTLDIDNVHGKIWFSGTVGSLPPKAVEGVVGSVFFRTKQIGTTSVGFAFEPQGTADSNIISLLGPVDLLKEAPRELTVTVREADLWERFLFAFKRIFSFDYLRF